MKRILGLILFVVISVQVCGQTDMQVIKKRLVKELLKVEVDDSVVTQAMATLKEDGSWPNVDYSDLSLVGYEHAIHIANLEAMAMSFSNKESKFYRSKRLKADINKALAFWCAHNFISDNWWHNIVLTPRTFVKIALIMEKDIDPELLEKLQPMIRRARKEEPWARQSADRVKICSIEAQNYVLRGEEEKFAEIIKVIVDQINIMTGYRGMQCDFSFHHRVHRVNNTISYGLGYGENCALWAACVVGTKYAFSEEKTRLLVDYFLDGLCKQMVYGMYDEKGVANRDITRPETDLIYSFIPMENLLHATDYRCTEIQEIIDLRRGKTDKPTLSFCKFFWQSEHFVFQRPDFYSSIRMYSTRNRNMELAHNSEGIFNHHKSDGANHLAVRGDEYLNIWPVYDWQKIPGTTVLQKNNLPSVQEIQKDGLTDFVGATTDGLYGVVAFDFISPHDNIHAKKSWFFFDEEYVCLGAGIASNHFRCPLVTTLNQSLLRGDVIVSNTDGGVKMATGEHVIDQANWVYHDGTGYLFPQPVKINLSNQTGSGRWSDINLQSLSPKELVYKDVFKLWIDHGVRPQGVSLWLYPGPMDTREVTYQYMVVPHTSPGQLNRDRGIEILSNTSMVQCVRHAPLGIVQVVFYEAGSVAIGDDQWVSLDSPGVVMLKIKEGRVFQISASDPSRKMSRFHLGLSGQDAVTINLPRGEFSGSSVTINL